MQLPNANDRLPIDLARKSTQCVGRMIFPSALTNVEKAWFLQYICGDFCQVDGLRGATLKVDVYFPIEAPFRQMD